MKKIKTPSADYAHLTEDGETTVCGRKVYAYWIEPEDEDIDICMDCEIEYILETSEEKEIEEDEESNDVEPVRATKPKRGKLASW